MSKDGTIFYMSNTISTYDVYGKEYMIAKGNLKLSIHVYGLAVKDGKILISPQYDGYDFPGGTANKGETHLETLKREFKEETGYDVRPVKLLDIFTSFFHHSKRNLDYQSYLIFYQVDIIGGELSDKGFDDDEKQYAKKAKWVPVAELAKMRHACSLDIYEDLLKSLNINLNV